MGDVGENFRLWKKIKKEKREKNLSSANSDGWCKHTEYHWSRVLNGNRLDYWPSRKKWQYNNKIMTGDVTKFISKRVKQ